VSPPASPPGILRTQWILLKVAARRFVNQFSSRLLGRKDRKRKATERKKRRGGAIAPIIAGVFFVLAGTSSIFGWLDQQAPVMGARDADGRLYLNLSAMIELEKLELRRQSDSPRIEEIERAETHNFFRARLPELGVPDFMLPDRADLYTKVFREKGLAGFVQTSSAMWQPLRWEGESARLLRNAVAWVLLLSFLTLTFLGLGMGNKDLAAVSWKFEWLYGFPVSARALFLSRIIELTLLNPASWVIHLAFFLSVFVSVGHGWAAIPLALLCGTIANLLIGSARAVVETLLRRFATLGFIKNVQALCTVLGSAGLLCLYALILRDAMPAVALEWIDQTPDLLSWLPPAAASGLVVPAATTSYLLAHVSAGAVAVGLATGLCELSVRRGLMSSGGVFAGPRGTGKTTADLRAFRGMVGKEVRLLLRDRNFLMQTLFVPLFMIGLQLVLYPQLFANLGQNKSKGLAVAFGIGAYVILLSAQNIFSSEKSTLWLLYTLPHRIEAILRRKAILWSGVALTYSCIVLALVWAQATSIEARYVSGTLMVLLGVPILALISAGQVILGADPLAQDDQHRVRPVTVYFIMFFAAVYSYGFYQTVWNQLPLVVLFSLLALSIWQRVRDQAPYLLDPTALPPASVSLSDGLAAALLFFVIQVALGGLLVRGLPLGPAMFLTFSVAGLLVFILFMAILLRRRVPHLMSALGFVNRSDDRRPLWMSAAIGVIAGGFAGLGALGYSSLSESIDALRLMKSDAIDASGALPEDFYSWLVPITVLAAPLFEEFIFRALIYKGLRRTTRFPVAVLASAAIFAIVHPSYSLVPVFGLGLATAIALEKGKRLLAPVLSHAVYNGMVLLLLN
jgi:membrane protease YdiL (CAAX protease family)